MTTLQRRLDDLRQRTTTSFKKPVVTGEIGRREAYSHLREYDLRSIGSDVSMSASEPLTRADVLTAAEASRLLGIPRSTLYALARRNELPARQIGRRWIFRRSLLERATLPLSEPDSWQRTFGSPGANRVVEMTRPLPANIARSARNR
jgi:excisionase family DNA binding protein